MGHTLSEPAKAEQPLGFHVLIILPPQSFIENGQGGIT